MSQPRAITRDDIISMEDFARLRADKRKALVPVKQKRRLPVGPDAMVYFESYETMWMQIHEMLFIEKGGEEQIEDELHAYNPLIPQGNELVATVMFEIDDPARRAAVLGRLGGVEETMSIEFDGEVIAGKAEEDVDRTTATGKASSVQFIHFPMTPAQAEKFKQPGTRVVVAINHKSYGHMAVMSEETRAELARDLD
jgi:hypothetical protein